MVGSLVARVPFRFPVPSNQERYRESARGETLIRIGWEIPRIEQSFRQVEQVDTRPGEVERAGIASSCYLRLRLHGDGQSATVLREWTNADRYVSGTEMVDAGFAEVLEVG